MANDTKYVQVTLVLEESGILDSDAVDSKYATRMYTLTDPSGMLDGDLELICTEVELERELKKLNAIPVVAKQVVVPHNGPATGQPSYPYTSTTGTTVSAARKKALLEAPPTISASALVNKVAEQTGTKSIWTSLLGDLVDDLLRPQK